MKRLLAVTIVAVAAAVSACADSPIMGVEPVSFRQPSFVVVTTSGTKICSGAVNGTVVTGISEWAPKLAGSEYVNKSNVAAPTIYRPRLGTDVITSTFSVPSNAIPSSITISGNVLADNDVVIKLGAANTNMILSTFPGGVDRSGYTYPTNVADRPRTDPNFTGTGLPFSASGVFAAGVDNYVNFNVHNDDDPNPAGNPLAVSFCYTVTYRVAAAAYWCSPGYWKNADDAAWSTTGIGGLGTRDLKYTTVIGPITRSNKGVEAGATTNPSIFYVMQNPNYYGGSAANAVADYLAGRAGWTGTQASGDACPLNNAGMLVGL